VAVTLEGHGAAAAKTEGQIRTLTTLWLLFPVI
jgi:hypothetical protein